MISTIELHQINRACSILARVSYLARTQRGEKFVYRNGDTTNTTANTVIIFNKGMPITASIDQLWFWTNEFQKNIEVAQRDIDNGDYDEYANVDDFINSFV